MEIIGLRYNDILSGLYKNYKSIKENHMIHFGMTMKHFWKFMRDSRLLTPQVSLAQVNRLFHQNPANDFKISFDYETIKDKIVSLKNKHFHNDQEYFQELKSQDSN